MSLNIGKALAAFELADMVDLNCGSFDIRIRQAALHNEEFRASVAKRSMSARKKTLVPEKGSLTGHFESDVDLFLDVVVAGWGERPLKNDDDRVVKYSKEVGRELFTSSKEGRVLFSKVMAAAIDDELFVIREEDRGNS